LRPILSNSLPFSTLIIYNFFNIPKEKEVGGLAIIALCALDP